MKQNKFFIIAITIVATLGGLLFGYDTAVISGTVGSRITSYNVCYTKLLREKAMELIKRYKVSNDLYEFQMLYGVTPELRKSIVV